MHILAPPKAQFDLDRQKGHERSKVAFYASKSTWVILSNAKGSLEGSKSSNSSVLHWHMSAVVCRCLPLSLSRMQMSNKQFTRTSSGWSWPHFQGSIHETDDVSVKKHGSWWFMNFSCSRANQINQHQSKLYRWDSNPRQFNMIRTQVDSRAHKTEPRHSWAQVPCPNLLCWAGVVGLIVRKETGLLKLSSFHFLVKLPLSDSVKSSDQHQE